MAYDPYNNNGAMRLTGNYINPAGTSVVFINGQQVDPNDPAVQQYMQQFQQCMDQSMGQMRNSMMQMQQSMNQMMQGFMGGGFFGGGGGMLGRGGQGGYGGFFWNIGEGYVPHL